MLCDTMPPCDWLLVTTGSALLTSTPPCACAGHVESAARGSVNIAAGSSAVCTSLLNMDSVHGSHDIFYTPLQTRRLPQVHCLSSGLHAVAGPGKCQHTNCTALKIYHTRGRLSGMVPARLLQKGKRGALHRQWQGECKLFQ